jgi:hypothetical protein
MLIADGGHRLSLVEPAAGGEHLKGFGPWGDLPAGPL